MKMSVAQQKLALLYERLAEMAVTRAVSPTGRRVRLENKFFEIDFVNEAPMRINAEYLLIRQTDVDARKTAKEQVEKLVVQLFSFPTQTPITDDGFNPYDFATALGLDRERTRFIIDYRHAGHLPTFSAVTQTREESSQFVLEHGGLYVVYRHDENIEARMAGYPTGVLTRAALSIRYPVPYRPHATDRTGGHCRIRCRLVIPAYAMHAGGKPYKYDGYIGVKDHWMQFLFQARPREASRKSEDLILMSTQPLPGRDGPPAHAMGVQFTTNHAFAPTVSTVVVMRHPGSCVVENQVDPKASYLQTPFSMPPDAEANFTRATVGALDLRCTHDPGLWSERDVAALSLLMQGWSDLNLRGLH